MLLHWMGPSDVFACLAAMVENHMFLTSSRLDTWKMLQAFNDLVITYAPKGHRYLMTVFPDCKFNGGHVVVLMTSDKWQC